MYGETMSDYGVVLPAQKQKRRVSFQGTISKEGREEMLKAVQGEIRRLVDAEDFGVKQLASIGFLAEQNRALLAELAVDIREEGEAIEKASAAGELGPMGEFQGENVMASTLSAETYGGGVLRELVPLAQKFLQQQQKQKSAPRIDELVSAAATARAEGMNDLADHLMYVVRRRTQTVDDAQADEATVVEVPAHCRVDGPKEEHDQGGNGKAKSDAVVST